jgi:hypothetical protein
VATATDACGSAFTLTFADVKTNAPCAGSLRVKRTWTATDACGNGGVPASQTINVVDTTPRAGDRRPARPQHHQLPGHPGVREGGDSDVSTSAAAPSP